MRTDYEEIVSESVIKWIDGVINENNRLKDEIKALKDEPVDEPVNLVDKPVDEKVNLVDKPVDKPVNLVDKPVDILNDYNVNDANRAISKAFDRGISNLTLKEFILVLKHLKKDFPVILRLKIRGSITLATRKHVVEYVRYAMIYDYYSFMDNTNVEEYIKKDRMNLSYLFKGLNDKKYNKLYTSSNYGFGHLKQILPSEDKKVRAQYCLDHIESVLSAFSKWNVRKTGTAFVKEMLTQITNLPSSSVINIKVIRLFKKYKCNEWLDATVNAFYIHFFKCKDNKGVEYLDEKIFKEYFNIEEYESDSESDSESD